MLLLSGCTVGLWSPKYQYEKISGIYLYPDGGKVFAAGVRHGYVFSADEKLNRILALSRNLKFTPYLTDFKLAKDNRITGHIELFFNPDNIPTEQKNELLSLGFKKGEYANSSFRYNRDIEGIRYEMAGDLNLTRFDKEISVGIALPDSKTDVAKKIVMTPAAVATDAVVTLPAGVLLVLIMATDSL
jgi:hypothetical protein